MRGRGLLVVGALALAGLVLSAVALVSALGADRHPPPPSDADLVYAIDGELGCDTDVTEAPTLPLEAEPLAMLVCADDAVGSMPWTAPGDLVEGDLSRLRDVLAGLEEVPVEGVDCTSQAGPAYDLLLRFSRDRYARIHGETGGCGFLTLASGTWFGAGDVLDTALALVEDQRRGRPAPTALPAAPTCPDDDERTNPYSLTGSASDLVVAVSCWRPDAPELGPFRPVVRVPDRDLAVLVEDVAERAAPSRDIGQYHCPGGDDALYTQSIVGRTAWGDLLSIDGWCHEFIVRQPWTTSDDAGALVWYPSARSQRILDDLRR